MALGVLPFLLFNNAVLQIGTSHWFCQKQECEKVKNQYFYKQKQSYVFFMCGFHKRTEVRFLDEWKVSTKKTKILEADVRLFPLDSEKEFTFMQIHVDGRKDRINKPLLRLVWMKDYGGVKDHIWAVILDDSCGKTYEKINIARRPDGFFKIKIEVLKNKIKIWFNGKLEIVKDVSYFEKYENYFKLGVYLQQKNCAKVVFRNIKEF
ncbi:Alginate lyase [Desulfurobacterium atlanticum]|uniref:Alginate lyase n=2 Tax=Desulfurobacterium atlanticum TaxID=240169 RepID=A0A238YBU3_9BACT|nr:Alginate lyase [Desulfurobacterium atlanticum]